MDSKKKYTAIVDASLHAGEKTSIAVTYRRSDCDEIETIKVSIDFDDLGARGIDCDAKYVMRTTSETLSLLAYDEYAEVVWEGVGQDHIGKILRDVIPAAGRSADPSEAYSAEPGETYENGDVVCSPLTARRILDWMLPTKDAEGIVGDLNERYAEAILPRDGKVVADLWFWWMTVWTILGAWKGLIFGLVTAGASAVGLTLYGFLDKVREFLK